jgi:type VI protein secretion system component VasF
MTEVDELLARLRKLPAVPLDSEFEASVRTRAVRRLRRRAPATPFAALALAATVVLYLGWALQFASDLYR